MESGRDPDVFVFAIVEDRAEPGFAVVEEFAEGLACGFGFVRERAEPGRSESDGSGPRSTARLSPSTPASAALAKGRGAGDFETTFASGAGTGT